MRPLLALAALFVVAACSRAPPAAERLVVATTAEPDTLCPLLTESGSAQEVIGLLSRELVVTDPSWASVPALAVRVPTLAGGDARLVDGKLVVDWRIREEAKWEDGVPVTAADFIFAWRVQRDPRQAVMGRDDAEQIERMEPSPDGKGFTVTWREPHPFFAVPRVHRPLPAHVLAPRLVERAADGSERLRPLQDDPIARQPLSDGPFRLVEHVPGQHLLFRRNEHFVPRALLDEVLVKIVPSSTVALTMLAAGDVDVVLPAAGPSPVEAQRFVDGHGAQAALVKVPGQVWTHIGMNVDDPWLQDVRVRRALALALPRDELFRAVAGGVYETAQTYLPPQHWGHASLPPLPVDVAESKRLLDEAGWTMPDDGRASDGVRRNARGDRLSLQLSAASGIAETEALLQAVRQAWKGVGVEVRVDLRPFKVFFGEGARKRKLPHLWFLSWTLDGSSMGSALWRDDKIPSEANAYKGSNLTGWKSAEATSLLQRAHATLDVGERRTMLARVQELVREQMPAIPMYFRPVVVVHRQGVQGLRPTGTLTPLTWNAEIWSRAAP